jgi:heterodisulfide reductase subunit A
MTKTIAVIGGGPAGMEAAAELHSMGHHVVLFEEKENPGGHLNHWDRLFPSKRKSSEVLDYLNKEMDPAIERVFNVEIQDIITDGPSYIIKTKQQEARIAEAILLSTGFQVFDAHRKEEYGYGIYDNVITSLDLEGMFREKRPIRTLSGKIPEKIGIIHCVGSRDEKVGNVHCSKVCCVTGVKQAIELKEALPESRVFCFYMDLRMFGMGYEELYKQSQEEYGVQFIRGRLSEAFENPDGSLVIKVEDTLTAKPLRMNVDLLVLLAGIVPSQGTTRIGNMLGLSFNANGFLLPKDEHTLIHHTVLPGVFLAGTCKGPKNIEETLADARSAATCIDHYLKKMNL